MHSVSDQPVRTMGLSEATLVGVGAIVGGGILALAGVAFAEAGPGAIAAFALNGVIALLTALSFAELAARFPRSGGTYTFARKVLTVEAAFAVGWVVWFASVVAAVLYALGFSAFLVPVIDHVITACGGTPAPWIGARFARMLYALAAVVVYSWGLTRTTDGGGRWITIGKVVVFIGVIAAGLWVFLLHPPSPEDLAARFRPFLAGGGQGLLQAMGFTFIALQGFDLIAAVGGEVRDPERTIPRAMFLSLGTALAIYIPLLFLITALGSPGRPIAETAAENPDILVAVAVRNFLGPGGYWLILVAGLLSMLSALQANLLAASRFARTMASDRTLPRRFERLAPGSGTPIRAITLTAVTVTLILIAIPDLAAAGAMSSLIFLGTFALAHVIAFLVRRRTGAAGPFRAPFFPLVPVVGGGACVALAMFQAVAVPEAGILAALWLAVGAALYTTQLAARAQVVDASAEGLDPGLIRLRGRNPLVLVPIANPASAPSLVRMAGILAPSKVARVQLLSVVHPPESGGGDTLPRELIDAQTILGKALATSLDKGIEPEALITLGRDHWAEIVRIARRTRCDSLLLGLGTLETSLMTGPLERLINRVEGDVVILRAPEDWDIEQARKILVPAGGRRDQSPVRARLIGSLCRTGPREITYLRVLPTDIEPGDRRRSHREIRALARDEAPRAGTIEITLDDDVAAPVIERASDADLLVLGLQRRQRRRRTFGPLLLEIARETDCPLLLISRRS